MVGFRNRVQHHPLFKIKMHNFDRSYQPSYASVKTLWCKKNQYSQESTPLQVLHYEIAVKSLYKSDTTNTAISTLIKK